MIVSARSRPLRRCAPSLLTGDLSQQRRRGHRRAQRLPSMAGVRMPRGSTSTVPVTIARLRLPTCNGTAREGTHTVVQCGPVPRYSDRRRRLVAPDRRLLCADLRGYLAVQVVHDGKGATSNDRVLDVAFTIGAVRMECAVSSRDTTTRRRAHDDAPARRSSAGLAQVVLSDRTDWSRAPPAASRRNVRRRARGRRARRGT